MTPVLLRNGQRAFVVSTVDVRPFTLQGKAESGRLELWTERGAWREDRTEHPLDIVGVITPCGHLVPLSKQHLP